ncbi:MAG: hypothetical protein AAB727_01810 [Patescibacteria group bacterium]
MGRFIRPLQKHRMTPLRRPPRLEGVVWRHGTKPVKKKKKE